MPLTARDCPVCGNDVAEDGTCINPECDAYCSHVRCVLEDPE